MTDPSRPRPPMDAHRLVTVKQCVDRAEDFAALKDAVQLMLANFPNYGDALDLITQDRQVTRISEIEIAVAEKLLEVAKDLDADPNEVRFVLERLERGWVDYQTRAEGIEDGV